MLTKRLKLCSWNIKGYTSREIGNKFRDKEFLKHFEEADFIGITETHIHEEILDSMSIPGFELFAYRNRSKNLKSGNAPGGISVFIRENLINLFEHVKMENEDTIWVKIKKEVSGEIRDIYIGTCYFNPARADESTQFIPNLIENILSLKSKGNIMINGDLNARTGNLDDTISPDKYDENFNISAHVNKQNRNSQDKVVNQRGNDLLDLCKSFDINIANGRTTGDLFGNYTMFNWNGSSAVDYLLTSESLSPQISSFRVGEYTPWFSDHCPIYSTLELCKGMEENRSQTPKKKAPMRFVWSDEGKQKFLNTLKTFEYNKKLDSALQLVAGDTNNAVNYVSDILISAARKAKIKTMKKREQENPPWFDTQCSNMKRNMKSLGKQIRKTPGDQKIRNELSILKKSFKKLVRNKKIAYKDKVMEKMYWSKKDSKSFWKLLDKIDHKHDDSIFINSISEGRWIAHFQNILQGPLGKCPLPKNTVKQGPLDFEISDEEIKLGSYILRNGKSPGHDSISNEMISCLLSVKPEIIKKLFNAIIQNPVIIDRWNTSLIFPLHKKGSKTNPDNYRGISLLSCFSKFFLAILNLRLTKFTMDNKILSHGNWVFLKDVELPTHF